jgi:hypothetical protein
VNTSADAGGEELPANAVRKDFLELLAAADPPQKASGEAEVRQQTASEERTAWQPKY